jgi:hypothetical protein
VGVTESVPNTTKLAVTDLEPFMVIVAGLVEPVKSPDQPEKE